VEMLDRLDELADLVETAKSFPLSQSCVLPRVDALDLIDDVKAALPDTVREAEVVVKQRDDILDDAERESRAIVAEAEEAAVRIMNEAAQVADSRRAAAVAEAEQILAEARMQSALIVDSHTITVSARDEATRLLNDAREQAELIVNATKHRSKTLLAKAESSLTSALAEVHHSLAELDSPAYEFVGEVAVERAGDRLEPRADHEPDEPSDGEFYDFRLLDEADGGGTGGYR
jgi:vacuolar-type H+-ATPase subunit H